MTFRKKSILNRLNTSILFGLSFSLLSALHFSTASGEILDSALEKEARGFAAQYSREQIKVPYPDDNPKSFEKEKLGQILFFDPRISGSKWISCNTCHNAGMNWQDGLPKGIGHGMGQLSRRSPTILDLAWGELYFWDGRAGSLEEQALGPIGSPGEMALPHGELEMRLREIPGYLSEFKKAYPNETAPLSEKNVGKAIATFERGLVSRTAPFDRWVSGDHGAISESAKRGFVLYNTKAKCVTCHGTWRFTDDGFHDLGMKDGDIGRGKILNIPSMQFAFKTPTLRNVAERPPYMHNGSHQTLREVVDFYNRGGDTRRPGVTPAILPLGLSSADSDDLVELLKTFSSEDETIQYLHLPN